MKKGIIPSKIDPARAEEANSKKNARNGSDENGGEAIFWGQRRKGCMIGEWNGRGNGDLEIGFIVREE